MHKSKATEQSSDSECSHDKVWRNINGCSAEHNRDKNACLNMFEIVQAHARGEARPEYLGFTGYEQVLESHKSLARKVVHEAKPHAKDSES